MTKKGIAGRFYKLTEKGKWWAKYGKRIMNLTEKDYERFFDLEKKIEWVKQAIEEIKHEPAHQGYLPSYRYMEGWLDGVRFVLEKLENILGEEDSGGSVECSRRTSHGIVSSQKIEGSSVEDSREPGQNQTEEASE